MNLRQSPDNNVLIRRHLSHRVNRFELVFLFLLTVTQPVMHCLIPADCSHALLAVSSSAKGELVSMSRCKYLASS